MVTQLESLTGQDHSWCKLVKSQAECTGSVPRQVQEGREWTSNTGSSMFCVSVLSSLPAASTLLGVFSVCGALGSMSLQSTL